MYLYPNKGIDRSFIVSASISSICIPDISVYSLTKSISLTENTFISALSVISGTPYLEAKFSVLLPLSCTSIFIALNLISDCTLPLTPALNKDKSSLPSFIK